MRARASGFFTKDYIEGIRARLDLSPSIDALIINSPAGKAVFEKKSGIIAYTGDYPGFNIKSPLYSEPQTASIRTDAGMTASISALSPLIDFNTLLYTARLSFLAILFAVTIAFAALIVDISIVKSADTTSKPLKLLNTDPKATDSSDGEAPAVQPSDDASDVSFVDEVHDASSGDEASVVPTSDDVADVPFRDEVLTDSSGDETFAVPTSGETANVPFQDEIKNASSGDEMSAVPFSVNVYNVPFQDDSLTDSFGKEISPAQSLGDTANVLSGVGQSDEYEELEELEGVDDADGEQTDEHEEIEEFGADERHIVKSDTVAFGGRHSDEHEELEELGDNKTSAEKNTAGTGLLAAASALPRNDHLGDTVKDMKEETGFSTILEKELTEAEKSGSDLAVLNIEGTDKNFTSEALIKQAAGFFKTGSRFFEKDDRTGIYIVVPDAGLDEIFAAAKDFYRRTVTESTSHSGDPELLIGISARSTRNVNSADLLNEAESALNKARFDKTLPIVGFRVNPQKYKDFIDKQRFPA
jgi:hypothetical protein